MQRFVLVLAFSMVTATASAQTPTPDPGKQAKPAKEKKICKRDKNTGSRMASLTCLTPAEWDERTRAGRATLDEFRATQNNRPM